MEIKLLLVEDDPSDRQGFEQSVTRFNHENGANFTVVAFDTLQATLDKLDSSFDCAVIDMKLGDQGGEGNKILEVLDKANFRMPVVVLTGTPDEADSEFVHIDVKKKGDAEHSEILKDFHQVHSSGLTKVMGGRGIIEKSLSKVFRHNLLSQKNAWKAYGQLDSERSERALMRHVMNHLISMVDMEEENCFPEEFYIHPPVDEGLRTGSVVRAKDRSEFFVVLTPLCDLTKRHDGEFNARKVMLCRISALEECYEELPESKNNSKGRAALRKNLLSNAKGSYHFLPNTDFFDGGYLDFENLTSIPKSQFNDHFSAPSLQISPAFIKDIVARFSAYFGRQGQPVLTQPSE